MSPIGIVKFIGAWFCIIAAVAFLVLGHQPFGFPGVLFIGAIAFAQAADDLVTCRVA